MEYLTDLLLETLATALNPYVLIIGVAASLALSTGLVARAIEALEATQASRPRH